MVGFFDSRLRRIGSTDDRQGPLIELLARAKADRRVRYQSRFLVTLGR